MLKSICTYVEINLHSCGNVLRPELAGTGRAFVDTPYYIYKKAGSPVMASPLDCFMRRHQSLFRSTTAERAGI